MSWGKRGRSLAARAADAPGWLVVATVVVFGAGCEAIQVASAQHDAGDAAQSAAAAAAFLVAGLLARQRQPDNHTGALLVLVAFALLAEDIQTADGGWVESFGELIRGASGPALIWLTLAFPGGRLVCTRDRAVVCSLAVVTVVGGAGYMLSDGTEPTYWAAFQRGPVNAFVHHSTDLLAALLTAATVVIAADRMRRSSVPARRVLTPFMMVAAALGLAAVPEATSAATTGLHGAALVVTEVATVLLPFAFLLGLVRLDIARADAIQAVTELGPRPSLSDVRSQVAQAIGDPALRILQAQPGAGLVDEAGRAAVVPDHDVAATPLRRDGYELGVMLHDPALRQDDKLLDSVSAAVTDVLARSRAEREAEQRAADARRRIERDLHDGAQQRLAAVIMRIDALSNYPSLDDDAHAALQGIGGEVRSAIADLRLLAHGHTPAVLAEEGLDAALRDLGGRAPNVTVVGSAGADVPATVAAAAYFVAAEGLTNALRHSGAGAIEVSVSRNNGTLALAIADDGRGGASLHGGSGLAGLRDRVTRLGGELAIESGAGTGTRLQVQLPVGGDGHA